MTAGSGSGALRLLIATDQWFPEVRGGLARVATDTARQFALRGHEVTVIAPAGAGLPAVENADGLTLLRALPRTRLPKTWTDPRWTARVAQSLGGRFDVVVGHTSTTCAGLAAARLPAPLVNVFHASAVEEAAFLAEQPARLADRIRARVVSRALHRYEATSLDRAARFLVLSEFSRGILVGRSPSAASRITLVPGGVDTDIFHPGDKRAARERLGLDPTAPLVLTVRRLEPRMGLELLIDAFECLLDIPRAGIVIGGSGPLSAVLEARRARSRAPDRIRLVGRIPDDDLVTWYQAADVFVVPTIAYEGFGIVTAESLACATPVVGTRAGATPELLESLDRRLLAVETDADSLAQAIRQGLKLAADDRFRDRCRTLALERWSWPRAIEAWEDGLRASLNARR